VNVMLTFDIWWLRRWRSSATLLEFSYRHDFIMPDTSPRTQEATTGDIASIFQELAAAEKTTDALEGRLSVLEKRLDELLEKLETEQHQQNGDSRSSS